jgi:hypothetical protein
MNERRSIVSKKSVFYLSAAAILLIPMLAATAQMHQHWGGSPLDANAFCPNFDLANKVSLDGTVESVNMERGRGIPTFSLVRSDGKKVTIIASPYWALVNANYKIDQGDRMSVLAYPSVRYENIYVAAELRNQTNGMVLTLRDDNGAAAGGRGGMCGACPMGRPGGF